MTKIYSLTRPVADDIVDAFCSLQKGFTDQFVYYDKAACLPLYGAGALHRACPRSHEVECEYWQGAARCSGAATSAAASEVCRP